MRARQYNRAAVGRETEAGMQFGADRFRRFTVDPHDQELAGPDRGARGEWPLSEISEVICERVTGQTDDIARTVEQLDPGVAVPEAIAQSVCTKKEIVRLHFIQPQGRKS